MRLGRLMAAAASLALLAAPLSAAQRGPAGQELPVIEKLTPEYLEVGKVAVEVAIAGRNFARRAEVRIRVKDAPGSGLDYAAVVESPALLRVRVPADLVAKPLTLELRVKNPDGMLSEWAPLEVRRAPPGGGGPVTVGGPVIDRVSPVRVEAGSRNVYVTVYGQGLVDGATVELRSGSTTAEARGQLVKNTLVVKLPDELLGGPQTVDLRVRGATGILSDPARVEVVASQATPGGATPDDPFVAQVDPQRVDLRGARSQTVELVGRGIDREGARVLLRAEGSGESGAAVPVVVRTAASEGTVIGVELTPNMVRRSGIYELRVVNPNGRQSNWVRLEVTNADPGTGTTGAFVEARVPPNVTLTAVSAIVPVEVTARNSGRSAVRVGEFAVLTPDGQRTPAPGSLEVPAGAERTLRLEAPVPLAAGAGSRSPVSYRMAIAYRVTPASGGAPADGRAPATGFETVSLRNEIALAAIGREYVRDAEVAGVEGWRFFKSDNPANEEAGRRAAGRRAGFFLFAEPLGTAQRRASEELFNFRPDPASPTERNLFFLVLRASEVDERGPRGRERGTRLGYVAVEQAPGLVPLYRWVRMDGPRAANHFLSVEREAARLPRQLQQQAGWRLDTVVGYVVPQP